MSCCSLAGSTLLMDDYGGSYRYHTLLRDFLQRELAVREPDLVPTLHRRAAAWYQANHVVERAVDHAFAAGDTDLVAALVGNGFVQFHWSGHRATIRAWARRLGVEALEARPWLAVLAAWEEIAAGDVAGTIRFADIAERGTFEGQPPDGTASFEAGRAMLRAGMARDGADDALANATRAVELEGDRGSWRDFALWQLAFARLTIGDPSGADAALADAVIAATIIGRRRDPVLRARTPRSRGRRTGRLGCRGGPDRGERSHRPGTPDRRLPFERPVPRRPHQADDPSRGHRRGASRAGSRDEPATAPDCRGPGRGRPTPSRARPRPPRGRRPGRRARA